MRIMVGCMVGTSLAMAPAMLLAARARFVDLDGPLLLARDRDERAGLRGQRRSAPLARPVGLSRETARAPAAPGRAPMAAIGAMAAKTHAPAARKTMPLEHGPGGHAKRHARCS